MAVYLPKFHRHLHLIAYTTFGVCLSVVCFSTSFWLCFRASSPPLHAASSNWQEVLSVLNVDSNFPQRRITHALRYSWPPCGLQVTNISSERRQPESEPHQGCDGVSMFEDWSVHSYLLSVGPAQRLTHAATVLQPSGPSVHCNNGNRQAVC